MSQTTIAVLGAGLFAKEAHLPAIAALGDKVKLAAVYSRSQSSAASLAELASSVLKLDAPVAVYHDGDPQANLDALLARPDIDAVAVVLPIAQQPDVILKSLEAGKHVLSEKPVAKDVASGIELIKTYNAKYKGKGLIWRVAENYELEPAFHAAAKAIRDGKIGKLSMFNLSAINALDETSKWYKTPWRTVPEYQGGFLLDGGVHSAAALRTVLPDALVSLSGHATLTKKYLAPQDTINAVVRTAGGAVGIFELSFAAPFPTRAKGLTTYTGTNGWIEIATHNAVINGKGQSVSRVTIHSVKEKGTTDKDGNKEYEEVVEVVEEPLCGVRKEFESFVEHLKGNDDGYGTPLGALRDVAFIEAALTSNGSSVSLTDLVPDL
ncbi:NAD(P)-binding protein [Auricularia subglabra TFB-10046 SS5]|nr:NAD(P)-binding protein [Auricularia subglabra TFB-10046 SS5]